MARSNSDPNSEQLVDASFERAAAHPVNLALEPQVLPSRGVLVGAGALTHHADDPPYGLRVRGYVQARHARYTFVGTSERREDAHHGRLAGAVGPEQPEHHALGHGE
jgi:hypothetical protein